MTPPTGNKVYPCPDRVYQRARQAFEYLRSGKLEPAKVILVALIGLGEHGGCPICSANVGGRAAVALDFLNHNDLPQCRKELTLLLELTQPY